MVSKWLLQSIALAPADFSTVDRHIRALSDILSLGSGIGLSEIWAGLSHHGTGTRDADKIRQLNTAARRLPLSANGTSFGVASMTAHEFHFLGLREDIFQLLALLTLPVALGDEEKAALDSLLRRLELVSAHVDAFILMLTSSVAFARCLDSGRRPFRRHRQPSLSDASAKPALIYRSSPDCGNTRRE